MKRLIAMLGAMALVLGLAAMAQAQRFGGTTSSGFSAPTNNSPGIPPSVTSVRPGNHNPGIPPSVTSIRPGWGVAPQNNFHHHHHHFNNNNNVIPVFVPVYSYPYYGVGDYTLTNEDDYIPSYARPQPYDQSSYQQPMAQPQAPGPTVMEQGYQPQPEQSYQQPAPTETATATPPGAPAVTSQSSQPSAEPAEPEPGTVLVFKDGHVMQIGNYVIVGNTLYNLSGEYRQYKIALADLDLDATVKANEDRGIEFHLPKNPA